MTTQTIFKTPWTPSLNGNALLPCQLTKDLIFTEVVPDPRQEGEIGWSYAGLRREVSKGNALAKDAIMESVVAIWRLRERDSSASGNTEWQNHLEAWLVSATACREMSGTPG